MAWKLEAGPFGARVDHTSDLRVEDPVSILLTYNERGLAHFTTLPSWRPNLREEVLIYDQDGVTVLFGGVVYQRQTSSVNTVTFTVCDCADWSIYGDWCVTDAAYGEATTLQVVLNDLVGKLAAYGVTLDTTDYTGVALDAFAWSNVRITDALRELSEKTGYIWRFSVTKVLSLITPGASAAPFNLSDATPHCTRVEWRDESSQYASKVRLICGPTGTATVTQSWTADGVATNWVTDFPSAGVMPAYVTVDGVTKSLAATTASKAQCFLSMCDDPEAAPPFDPSYNFANNETVAVAGRTYTFKTALTPTAGEILIGATSVDSLNALISAIMNYDGGSKGVTWAAATPAPHADIEAYWLRDNMVKFRALVAGVAGNAFGCTTTAAHALIYGEGNVPISTFELGSDAVGAEYEFNIPTHTLSVGTDPVPTNGTIITLTYAATFPFTVTAGNDTVPMVEYVATAPTVMSQAVGQAMADELLARLGGSQKTLEFRTVDAGLEPGQELSAVLADRGLNVASAFIQILEITLISDTWWEYRVTAIEGSEYLGSYLEYFRKLPAGGGSGTPVITNVDNSITIMGAPPAYYLGGSRFHAVQVP